MNKQEFDQQCGVDELVLRKGKEDFRLGDFVYYYSMAAIWIFTTIMVGL